MKLIEKIFITRETDYHLGKSPITIGALITDSISVALQRGEELHSITVEITDEDRKAFKQAFGKKKARAS